MNALDTSRSLGTVESVDPTTGELDFGGADFGAARSGVAVLDSADMIHIGEDGTGVLDFQPGYVVEADLNDLQVEDGVAVLAAETEIRPAVSMPDYAPGENPNMLVLSRQRDESIIIGDNIVLTVVDIRGDKVRLGIEAPKEIPVHRQEVYDAIKRENEQAAQQQAAAAGNNQQEGQQS